MVRMHLTKRKSLSPSRLQLPKTLWRKLLILLSYLLTTGIVLFVFIVRPGINGYERAMFPDMVYGKAYKPFVYRTLLPTTVRIIAEITPAHMKDEIRLRFQNRRMINILKWETEYIYEYLVALVIMFGCFLGFAYLLRYLVRLFYNFPSFVADLAPVGGLLILPIFFKYYSYIYDPGTLFLFTLAIILIAKRKHWLYYIVFVLATLNKETSILLLGIFLIREFKVMGKATLARHLLFQTLIWIAVKASITAIFRDNPGSFCEFHLDYNLGLISEPYRLFYFVSVILISWALIRYRWAEKPVFLRRGLFIAVTPLMLTALVLGFLDELRCFYEAFPFLFLLSLPTIVDIFGLPPNNTSEVSPPK
jgi:hypothetical protein